MLQPPSVYDKFCRRFLVTTNPHYFLISSNIKIIKIYQKLEFFWTLLYDLKDKLNLRFFNNMNKNICEQ